jgi:large subunit ribosomal protein L25
MATATESTVLEAQARVAGTKNDARRVRVGGKVPAVLYGAGKEALSVSLDPRQVSRILHSQTGYNTIFDLALDGGERTKAMIVDWQYEPIKGALLHIDLKRIAMDKTLTVNVPIVLKGEAVEIECLPGDIPAFIEADVTELVFGKVLRVSDLPHGDKLKFLTDPNQPVATVITVKEEVVATPEAVAAEAGATPAEPEVIKKGKQEVGEEGAEPAAEKSEKPEKKEKK